MSRNPNPQQHDTSLIEQETVRLISSEESSVVENVLNDNVNASIILPGNGRLNFNSNFPLLFMFEYSLFLDVVHVSVKEKLKTLDLEKYQLQNFFNVIINSKLENGKAFLNSNELSFVC